MKRGEEKTMNNYYDPEDPFGILDIRERLEMIERIVLSFIPASQRPAGLSTSKRARVLDKSNKLNKMIIKELSKHGIVVSSIQSSELFNHIANNNGVFKYGHLKRVHIKAPRSIVKKFEASHQYTDSKDPMGVLALKKRIEELEKEVFKDE